jgi:translation elongation factor EF-Tu-like GTPase
MLARIACHSAATCMWPSEACHNGQNLRCRPAARYRSRHDLPPHRRWGAKNPVFSGYRPQFYYQGDDWDAIHTYLGVEQVNPGDTVTAQLRFVRPQFHVGKIAVRMEFLIREGNRTVAKGKVTKTLDLEKTAARMGATS